MTCLAKDIVACEGSADFREEWIVVGEPVSLLDVAARSTDIEDGLDVGVHKSNRSHISNQFVDQQVQQEVLLELVAVCVNLELAAVVMTLQGDQVSEASNSAAVIFPVHRN